MTSRDGSPPQISWWYVVVVPADLVGPLAEDVTSLCLKLPTRSRYHLGQLSLSSLRVRKIEYMPLAEVKTECVLLCQVEGNIV